MSNVSVERERKFRRLFIQLLSIRKDMEAASADRLLAEDFAESFRERLIFATQRAAKALKSLEIAEGYVLDLVEAEGLDAAELRKGLD